MSGHDYRNEIDWLTPALALAVWAGHFTLLWAASSIFPGHVTARWIAAALTLAGAGALVWLWRNSKAGTVRSIPGLSIAIAGAGIAFVFLPALVG